MAHDTTKAEALQAARVAADLANHRERVTWLQSGNPVWADGSRVDAHSRHALLTQSLAAISAAKVEAA